MEKIDLSKDNILYISGEQINIEEFRSDLENKIDYLRIRKKVEPWLTALFQSEHLSLLVGTGLSIALGKKENQSENQKENLMGRMELSDNFKLISKKQIKKQTV